MIGVNRGRLEFPADAEAVNLVFVHADEIEFRPERDGAGIGFGAAGDEVEERGLAGAVGADDGAQFAFIHVEVEVR